MCYVPEIEQKFPVRQIYKLIVHYCLLNGNRDLWDVNVHHISTVVTNNANFNTFSARSRDIY